MEGIKPGEERRKQEISEIDSLQAEVNCLESVVSDTKRTEDIDSGLARRIVDRCRKILFQVAGATALLSMAIQANHIRTRHEIIESAAGSEQDFKHEDPETTLVTNYLLGKERLPKEQQVFAYREIVREIYKEYQYPTPENFANLDQVQLQELLTKHYQGLGYSEEMVANFVETKFEYIASLPEVDAELEKLIWEMQKEVGAPKIRWASEGADLLAQLQAKMTTPGRAFYDPLSNTIYINPSPHVSRLTLLGEDAHAKQFNEKPLLSYARGAAAILRTVGRSVSEFQDLQLSYSHEYRLSASLESEAHGEIKEGIMEDLERRYSIKKD